MQKPDLEALINKAFESNDLINYLKTTLKDERMVFEEKKIYLSELDQIKQELQLARVEHLITTLELNRINSDLRRQLSTPPTIQEEQKKDNVQHFLAWDKQATIETLNFLLAEFFANSFPGKEWDNDFIAEIVFETTRLVNFISNLKKAEN